MTPVVVDRDRSPGTEALSGRSKKTPQIKQSLKSTENRRYGRKAKPLPALAPDPREQLRNELRRWSLCKTLVHQFALIAQPLPRAETANKAAKRKQGGAGERRAWRPYAAALKRLRRQRAPINAEPTDNDIEGGAFAALAAYYGAKIAATRRSVPRQGVAAAVRAVLDEQQAAMRALASRQRQMCKSDRTVVEPDRPSIERDISPSKLMI